MNETVIGTSGLNNTPMTGVVNNGSYIQAATGGQSLHLGTGTVSAIDIDPNQRVSMPKQPYGLMKKLSSASQTFNTSGSKKLTFNSSTTTNGMSFSNTNTRLTVPVGGRYFVSAMAAGGTTTADSGDGVYLRVYKNGATLLIIIPLLLAL